MSGRRFGRLDGRSPAPADEAFLEALYLDTRPDLAALPVPRGVIEGIGRHQRRLQRDDYARRYPASEIWLVCDAGQPVARLVLDRTGGMLRVVDLSVALDARRRGVARALLRCLQEECDVVALRVRADNVAARALYAGLGFVTLRDDGASLELVWTSRPLHPD